MEEPFTACAGSGRRVRELDHEKDVTGSGLQGEILKLCAANGTRIWEQVNYANPWDFGSG